MKKLVLLVLLLVPAAGCSSFNDQTETSGVTNHYVRARGGEGPPSAPTDSQGIVRGPEGVDNNGPQT